MAIRYYDDLIIQKLQHWVPEESKKFFELTADDNKDKAFQLPLIAISRKDELELLSTVKAPKTYDGLRLIPSDQATDFSKLKGTAYQKAVANIPEGTYLYNVISFLKNYYNIEEINWLKINKTDTM